MYIEYIMIMFYFFQSSVSRVLEPTIFMELNFASGESKTINIPISQFHNLRFQVASCINKLNHISV